MKLSRFMLALCLLASPMLAQAQTVTVTAPNTVNPSGSPTAVGKTFLINPDGTVATIASGGGGAVTVANGADVTQGAIADSAYAGSGSATVVSVLKGLYTGMVAPTPAGTNNIGGVNVDNVLDGATRNDTVSSATSSPTISTAGYGQMTFEVTANASANTIVLEGSNDAATWAIIPFRIVSTATQINVTSLAPTAGTVILPLIVMPNMRWRVSTYVAGSTTVYVGFKRTGMTTSVDAAVSSLTSIPAGGNNIGVVNPSLGVGAGSGTGLLSSYVLSSAASTNSNLILTGLRRMVAGQICNVNATTKQYVKFYNKATAPTVGTDTPLDIFTLQPNTCLALEPMIGNFGQHFSLGLGIGITGGFPVADTTAVAAGDVTVNVLYL